MIEEMRQAFITPGDEFTPIPFWFWNDELNKEKLARQIQDFYEKGVRGFVIHPRIGIPNHIEYLSDSFMELVRFAVKEAASRGMKVVLYDEAMYPSGSAHGKVVEGHPQYASCGLKMTELKWNKVIKAQDFLQEKENLVAALAVKKISSTELDSEDIVELDIQKEEISFVPPDEEGWSILLFIEGFSKGTIRGIHFGEDDGEENPPPSADLLNPDAMKKFIRLTHERYYECLEDFFGTTIIAMFTDEPNILGRNHISHMIPWTFGFLDWYIKEGNTKEDLAALWFDIGKETEKKKRNYKRAINKKLRHAYYGPIAKWCENHDIALTGHPESSEDMELLKAFQIPGQDVVWRWVAPENNKGITGPHSTMAKCSSDIARHGGRRRNANECFGCCSPEGTNWGFSAADMKWYLDWLFVRGVNLIYPHAFYYSIEGERRINERPPDVGPNNIWWEYYKDISQYIKRMSWIMTDGSNRTPIAVLCEEDQLPWKIVQPLYENQIEFNYLDLSSFLSSDCQITEEGMKIQQQNYQIMIIENEDLLYSDQIEKFKEFIDTGGSIIVHQSKEKQKVLEGTKGINRVEEIIPTLDGIIGRDVILQPQCRDLRVSHVIKNNIHFYIFVNEGNERIQGELLIRNKGKAEIWDPWKGTTALAPIQGKEGKYSSFDFQLNYRESKILSIDPKVNMKDICKTYNEIPQEEIRRISEKWTIHDEMGRSWEIQNLSSWTEWEGMEHYSGTLCYETIFSKEEKMNHKKIYLDLGTVHEIAHVYINEQDVSYKMWSPYSFDITDYIISGKNKIFIEVKNSLTNKRDGNNSPSGLIGPVKIRCMN